MKTFRALIEVKTPGRGTYEITDRIQQELQRSGVVQGSCLLFIQHTSASLLITENADPDVRKDLETFMAELSPDGDRRFVHTAEGADDMPAHVRSVLCETSLTIPISDGKLDIGTWQGIFVYEHRHAAHRRSVSMLVMGDTAYD